jgi:hypothetical protein
MARKYDEYINIKLPAGAKEELVKVAASKYDSVGEFARKLLMKELEESGVYLLPPHLKPAA